MLFGERIQDYEVTGLFKNNLGKAIAEKRICHNMSKKEAKMQMRVHLLRAYSESIDLNAPVRINVEPVRH
ncbi:hypothetical protein ACNAN0_09435 [Agrilactobacillus fermenti]|uniref:hypothetical protein n=1 Tax=Agrilactobacillus fermenti TaxID=2586909 RepID=UPI001E59DF9E|nr:hypothetical protein [Agrilactobacillus fermenti]MCD2255362.1 hypothetical protein [Agrilactobacillus fermenti]